jgi:hypothetical protein
MHSPARSPTCDAGRLESPCGVAQSMVAYILQSHRVFHVKCTVAPTSDRLKLKDIKVPKEPCSLPLSIIGENDRLQ